MKQSETGLGQTCHLERRVSARRELGLIAKSCAVACGRAPCLLRGFRDVSVLAVLVTAYEVTAAAVMRNAMSALGRLRRARKEGL